MSVIGRFRVEIGGGDRRPPIISRGFNLLSRLQRNNKEGHYSLFGFHRGAFNFPSRIRTDNGVGDRGDWGFESYNRGATPLADPFEGLSW
jgi:hypothetical protein